MHRVNCPYLDMGGAVVSSPVVAGVDLIFFVLFMETEDM
jgi:hypothetical protein